MQTNTTRISVRDRVALPAFILASQCLAKTIVR